MVLSLVVLGTSASELDDHTWRLDHHGHHHMMQELCGENGEKCDHEHMDRMHSFWQHGKPCDKGFKYPRHLGPRDTDTVREATVTSLMQDSNGLNQKKVVIVFHPVLGRRGGPFGIDEGDDVPEIMARAMEHMMERSRELRKQYINAMSGDKHMRFADMEEMMMSKVQGMFRMETLQQEEQKKEGWKHWFRHCMEKMQAKTGMRDRSTMNDDYILSALKGIDWRLWDEEGHLNAGLLLFIALVCTSAAIWTSLMVQLVQYIFVFHHSSEYEELDTQLHKGTECSETKGLLKEQEPHVK